MTAIIMVVCLGTTISHAQWTAIAIQVRCMNQQLGRGRTFALTCWLDSFVA